MVEDVNIDVQSFRTEDGGQTLSVAPLGTRRQRANWYVWIKPDGSGILVTKSGTRVHLPKNS